MSIVRCCQINIEWETDEQKTFIINLSHYCSCNLMNTALILSLVYYLSISLYLPLNFNTVFYYCMYCCHLSYSINVCMYKDFYCSCSLIVAREKIQPILVCEFLVCF